MGNYKQDESVAWLRSKQVVITNEYNKVPSIEFQEEFIVESEGSVISKTQMGKVTAMLSNPNVEFDLLNPTNDAVIGTAKFIDSYVILYSLYRYLGNKRDVSNTKLKLVATATEVMEAARIASGLADSEASAANVLALAAPNNEELATAAVSKASIAVTKKAEFDAAVTALAAAQSAYDASLL